MSTFISVELLLGILAGLVTAMVVLIVLQVRNSVAVQRLAAPVYDFVIHEAEERAKEIVDEARREAKQITAQAEKEREKLIDNYTAEIATLQKVFEDKLSIHTENLEKTIDTTFSNSLAAWEKVSLEMQKQLQTTEQGVVEKFALLQQSLETSEKQITSQAATAMVDFEKQLTDTVVKLKEKMDTFDSSITTHIDEHTKEALATIDNALASYRRAREHILDAHMAQIIETVTAEVLHTQLTLQEHAELTKRALLDAKERNLL